MIKTDLVIIGSGPAGMSAAITAAELGIEVVVIDEQRHFGGQIYRDVEVAPTSRSALLGKDYSYGKKLTEQMKRKNITHISDAVVFSIETGWIVSYTSNEKAGQIACDRLILATGALERPMTLPGWTLPGVMTAGAGQILLKQSGVVAREAVLVGSGPLLYLIAAQMVRSGHPPLALIETQTMKDMLKAFPHYFGAIKGFKYLAKGIKLLYEIIKAGVPRYVGAKNINLEGINKVEAVVFQKNGKTKKIKCQSVFLHHGIIPNTQAARSIGVNFTWNDIQQCFVPVVDEWGKTNLENVFIAGDGAGIGGARVAEYQGNLTALKIAHEMNKIDDEQFNRKTQKIKSKKNWENAVRPFLDISYPPSSEALSPVDSTIICRCEEVTAGDVRNYAKLGCIGPNQTKAYGRVGMGLCQGRYCGLTVTKLLSEANQISPEKTGYYRIRPPLKPVTLGELATMDTGEHE